MIDFSQDIPYQTAYDAYRNISQVPEDRAKRVIAEWSASLNEVRDKVLALAGDRKEEAEAAFTNFRNDMRGRYLGLLRYRSGLASAFVVGPSKFPVAKQQKKHDREHVLQGEYLDAWKRQVKKLYAAFSVADFPVSIRTGEAGAADALAQRIAALEEKQEHMKTVNALLRKYKKEGAEAQVAAIVLQGLSEGHARVLVPNGYASFELTNNNANLRRLREQHEKAITLASTETSESETNGVRIVDNKEEDRVQMFFPVERVSRDMYNLLKSHGFVYSRTNGCFQARRGHNASYWAQYIAEQYA